MYQGYRLVICTDAKQPGHLFNWKVLSVDKLRYTGVIAWLGEGRVVGGSVVGHTAQPIKKLRKMHFWGRGDLGLTLLRCHAATDSLSLEADDDSASTSVIMDSEYVMPNDCSATVVQSNNQTDHPPPTSAARATGIRRIPTGIMYPSIV